MTDRPIDLDVETRLRGAFRSAALPAAPASLLDALERIPDAPLMSEGARRASGRNGRRTLGLLGLAAVLAVGGAVAFSMGSGPGPSPDPGPSVVPGVIVTYRLAWSAATPADPVLLGREIDVVRARLAAAGGGTAVRADGTDRLVVGIPAGLDVDAVRSQIGQTGVVSWVPLGTTPALEGDLIDPAKQPALFENGILDAAVDVDQSGQRVVTIQLDRSAAILFEQHTSTHVGEFFAIVLDGRVVTAPQINSAIPGGNIQISQNSTVGGFDRVVAASLVALLTNGPLPVPLVEVSSQDGLVEAVPTALPTAVPTPTAIAAGPAVVCDPVPDDAGQEMTCEQALNDALLVLPVVHPIVSRIDFVHDCAGAGSASCLPRTGGTVTYTFADGSPPLRVRVSIGQPARILP